MIDVEITQELDFSGFNDLLDKEIKRELNQLAIYLVRYARKNHKFTSRTGNLIAATKADVDKALMKLNLYISDSAAYYGVYVHEGHGSWNPDRFIDRAILENTEYINQKISLATKRATKMWNKKNRL